VRVQAPLFFRDGRVWLVTDAGMRLAALVFVAILLASAPLLPDRGGDEAVNSPAPAALSFSATTGGVLLSRVYPNAARGDEFVDVVNTGIAAVDLSGWSLTDGEAAASFPRGTVLPPGGRLVATKNATTYAEDVLALAQFTWDSGGIAHLEGGTLRLADSGDEVLLVDDAGSVIDAYVYGTSDYTGPGWSGEPAEAPGRGELAIRGGGIALADHDTAEDWEGPRPFRLGQSSFDPAPVIADGPAIPLVSPEDAAGRLLPFLGSARHSIHIAVYTLTSEAIASVLADRARHGLRIQILLEAAPVGGVEESEERIVGGLTAAGAQVRWLAGGEDHVKRYRYLHAKYAVVDSEGVFIGSENFGDSGFPLDGRGGNRGWSVIVRDPELASQLRDVFDEDFDPRRRDTMAAATDASAVLPPPQSMAPWIWPESTGAKSLRLLVGPDNLLEPDGLLGLMESAHSRLWIEAFYVEESWGGRPNPLLEAAFGAARRGVDVRLLLDRGYWDPETEADANEAVAEAISVRAQAEGVDFEVRLLNATGRIERLHNKGLLVDGRAVLVSSVNWARVSVLENREVGLLLEDPEVATVFEEVFRRDWVGIAGPIDLAFLEDPAILLRLYGFVAAASALTLRKLRRGDKGLKRRNGMETRGLRGSPLRRRRREVRVLPAELVAEPRPRSRRRRGDRRGGEEARGGLRGPEGH